jgi:signal transduction histidine kinase
MEDGRSRVHNRCGHQVAASARRTRRSRRKDGNGIRLTIPDAGIGLSAESLDSLFEAFYTTKSAGMGIGLFVSGSIIEGHHGRLWAEPNKGAPGASFSFSIPRRDGRDELTG